MPHVTCIVALDYHDKLFLVNIFISLLLLIHVGFNYLVMMVVRLLSYCGVLESTSLDLDPLTCGYLVLEPTHMAV